MTLEELQVIITAETKGLKSELKQVKTQLGSMGAQTKQATAGMMSSFNRLAAGIAALGIGKLIKDSIADAMGVESSVQQIDRQMSTSSDTFTKWANTQANAFNMASAEALKYGSVYGNLISGFADDAKDTTKKTIDLLKASAIISSGTGRTMSDTMDRIRSGMLGSTEAIEDLGINVNIAMIESTDAFKRFAGNKSWNQLDFQLQQKIRHTAILEQAFKKYGDTVNKNTKSNMQGFLSVIKDISVNIGKIFIPVLNAVIPTLKAIGEYLKSVTATAAEFMEALFGYKLESNQTSTATNKATSANNNLADSFTKTGKAAEKAKKSMAGFDTLTTIGQKSAKADGISSGSSSAPTSTNKATSTKNLEQLSKFQALIDKIKSALKPLTDAFERLKIASAPLFDTVGKALKWLWDNVLKPLGKWTISDLLPTFLDTLGSALSVLNEILVAFKPLGDWLWKNFLKPIAEWTGGKIIEILNGTKKSLDNFDTKGINEFVDKTIEKLNEMKRVFQKVADDIRPSMKTFNQVVAEYINMQLGIWGEWGNSIGGLIDTGLSSVISFFESIWTITLKPIVDEMAKTLKWLWDKHLKGLLDKIGYFVKSLIEFVTVIYNKFISPLVDRFIKHFGPKIAGTFKTVINIVGTVIGVFADLTKGIFGRLGGLMEFLTGVFTGDWKKAWNGIKSIFQGVFDSLWGIAKGVVNLIIDALNKCWTGVYSVAKGIVDSIGGVAGALGKVFGQKWSFSMPANPPTIPKLARGGIIDRPTVAMVGEAGREAVVPLENTGFVRAIGTAVSNSIKALIGGSFGNSGDLTVIMQLDGLEIGRAAIKNINQLQRQSGTMLVRV